MQFRIADTFTNSLTKLPNDVQKIIKTTAFDLQLNPENPGLSFHKLDRVKDKNFWSIRVNKDIRLIVHKSQDNFLLCYVDHHDEAYKWAQKRKLETHPTTGAAQFVEIRDVMNEEDANNIYYFQPDEFSEEVFFKNQKINNNTKTNSDPLKKQLFINKSSNELLSYGVPEEWIDDVKICDEDELLELCDHLPAEAAEALLELATGGNPKVYKAKVEDPFDHPDAQRRFRIMENTEELEKALDFPWEKWTIFLHPEQKQIVEKDYSGPVRISGSAGTGKTIVALHRAVYLARINLESRILLTTYSDTLASSLKIKLKRLLGNEPRLAERIDVYSIDAIGIRLYKLLVSPPNLIKQNFLLETLRELSNSDDYKKFKFHFLLSEWEDVVDAWQISDWEAYRDVMRLGRKTRLLESQRKILWDLYSKLQSFLDERNLLTSAKLFTSLARKIKNENKLIYNHIIVDESQDINMSHLKFMHSLGGDRDNALFFSGDLGQRIFQQPFSWKSLGVDIRGRSQTLKVNYRTSHQIRSHADLLLGPSVSDLDGNTEDRSKTISVFNGPNPLIGDFDNNEEEIKGVAQKIKSQIELGVLPHEMGVFVRSKNQIERAEEALKLTGFDYKILDHDVQITNGSISIITMNLAKGLEFRSVIVMCCDDEVLPLQDRIESIGDDADLQEVYDTERHLLYVACTRARDYLFVTGVKPLSEFLDDMNLKN